MPGFPVLSVNGMFFMVVELGEKANFAFAIHKDLKIAVRIVKCKYHIVMAVLCCFFLTCFYNIAYLMRCNLLVMSSCLCHYIDYELSIVVVYLYVCVML